MNEAKEKSPRPDDLKPYLLEDLFKDFEKRREGLTTGFPRLDQLASILPGTITVITARTSQGKTCFLLNLIVNILRNDDKKVYFFSYEDSKRSIATKLIMIMADEILQDESDNFENYERYLEQYRKRKRIWKNSKVEQAISDFGRYTSTGRLAILDHAFDADKLAGYIQKLGSKETTGAIFVDYIQKIPIKSTPNQPRYRDLQRVSEKLLEAIKGHKVPLIVAAQARIDNIPSRSTKAASVDKTPIRLDSIREAADIGHDASLVLGLDLGSSNNRKVNKKGKTKTANNQLLIEVSILKNRNGKAGDIVTLLFNGPVFKISESNY